MEALVDNIIFQINQKMREKNINVELLEKLAGLNRGVARNIVTKRSKDPRITTLLKISQALGCELTDLTNLGEIAIEQAGKATFHQVETPLNKSLLKEITDYVINYIAKHEYNISFERTLNIINNAYKFCLAKKENRLDKEFIEWIFVQELS